MKNKANYPGARAAALVMAAILFAAMPAALRASETNNGKSKETQPAEYQPKEIHIVSPDDVKKLVQQAKGKVTVINLWATWCPPCVAEMPYFEAFYKEYTPKKANLYMISADGSDNIDSAVKPFQKREELPFPIHVLEDVKALDEYGKAMKVKIDGVLPTTIIYDQKGQVKKVWEGAVTLDKIKEAVDPLL